MMDESVELKVALTKLSAEVAAVGDKVDKVYWHLERQNGRIDKLENKFQIAEDSLEVYKGSRAKMGGIYVGIAATLAILASIITLMHNL